QENMMQLVPLATGRGDVHPQQADTAIGQIARGLLGERRKFGEETLRPKLAVPARFENDACTRADQVVKGFEIVHTDIRARLLGYPEQMRRAVKPVERHLIDRLSIVEKMIHRIEMRTLVSAHAHLG